MKVFISWSKPRSQAVAAALREWLPDVIQSCEPWMSQEDIQAGQRWSREIEEQLNASVVGIICVTPENQREPWLNFEAGAISKKVGTQGVERVAPYILDMRKDELQQPLGQFQIKVADRNGTFGLLQMINQAQEKPLIATKLESTFNKWWPGLEMKLQEITKQVAHPPIQKRSLEDKVDELLDLARTTSRRLEAPEPSLPVAETSALGMQRRLEQLRQAYGLGLGASQGQTVVLTESEYSKYKDWLHSKTMQEVGEMLSAPQESARERRAQASSEGKSLLREDGSDKGE